MQSMERGGTGGIELQDGAEFLERGGAVVAIESALRVLQVFVGELLLGLGDGAEILGITRREFRGLAQASESVGVVALLLKFERALVGQGGGLLVALGG